MSKRIISILLLFIFLFALLPIICEPVSATGWYNNNWHYRRQITFDHTRVLTNLSFVPLLVNATLTTSHVQSAGQDVVFTSSDGTTKIPDEIESYSSSSGQLLVWVNVTSLSRTVDTVVYLYYGNAGCADQQDPAHIWNKGYVGVWHMQNASGNRYDSSRNGNYLTSSGTTHQTGLINGAESFTKKSHSLESHNKITATNVYSFTCLMKFENATGDTNDIVFADPSNNPSILRYSTGKDDMECYIAGAEKSTKFYVNSTKWYFFSLVSDGTRVHYWANYTEILNTSSSASCSNNYIWLGDNTLGTDTFTGVIDETEVSTIVRNQSWIKVECYNKLFYSSFVTVAGEYSAFPPIISGLSPVQMGLSPVVGIYISKVTTVTYTVADQNGGTMDAYLRSNASGSWSTVQTNLSIHNSTLHYTSASLFPSTNHSYWYSVNVSNIYAWTNTTIGFYQMTVQSYALTVTDNTVNTTGGYTSSYSSSTGWTLTLNEHGVLTPLHIRNATTYVKKYYSYKQNATGWWVYDNDTSSVFVSNYSVNATTYTLNYYDPTGQQWVVEFDSYGKLTPLHIRNNTVNVTKVFVYKQNSTGWWVYDNDTGNTTPIHLVDTSNNCSLFHTYFLNYAGYWVYANAFGPELLLRNNVVNVTGTHQGRYNASTNKMIAWFNGSGNLTPLHLLASIINATGTHTFTQNGTGYWVLAQYMGNLTPLHLLESIVNATGTHTYTRNGTGYWVLAQYRGNGSGNTSANYTVVIHLVSLDNLTFDTIWNGSINISHHNDVSFTVNHSMNIWASILIGGTMNIVFDLAQFGLLMLFLIIVFLTWFGMTVNDLIASGVLFFMDGIFIMNFFVALMVMFGGLWFITSWAFVLLGIFFCYVGYQRFKNGARNQNKKQG